MRIVCISDTHGWHRKLELPDGDVLIHAGDICRDRKTARELLEDFDDWLGEQPYAERIVVAGNHDVPFEETRTPHALLKNARYLQDEEINLGGLRFYGTPWQPWFYDWAFNWPEDESLMPIWNQIPSHVDVLITHTPPQFVLDRTWKGKHAGCPELTNALKRIQPRLHIFGHIHESAGGAWNEHSRFINACSAGRHIHGVLHPSVIDLEPR